MIFSAVHNHCTWDDGKSTPRRMAQQALALGFTALGFSSHAETPFDGGYALCDAPGYIADIRALAREYEGRMQVYCGVEQDFYTPVDYREKLDYLIGSVHYLRSPQGKYYPVDGTRSAVQGCIDEMFGGDGQAFAEAFFALTAQNAEQYRPDIIGHFDLLCKNNADKALFDDTTPAYRRAALDALHRCAACGSIFEVNTGGMARGYMQRPYPDMFLLRELAGMGARVMLSADCHNAQYIAYAFDEARALLREAGFAQLTQMDSGQFVSVPL